MTLGSVRRPGFCADAPLVANRSRARPFFLVAALHLRLYADDPAGLTIVDFMHWLTWHRFAGVERVFVFDAHVKESERFGSHAAVRGAVDSGFLTYVDWGDVAKRNVRDDGSLRARHVAAVQLPAMVEAWRLARDEAKWMLFIDVDEYAQVPGAAAEPGFLARRVRDVGRRSNSRGRPVRVSQIVFPTVIFEGPRDAARGPMLAQQVSRARDARHNKSATKSAVRLDALAEVNVHRSSVDFGETVALDRSRAFVGHYHAGRTVGFKGAFYGESGADDYGATDAA